MTPENLGSLVSSPLLCSAAGQAFGPAQLWDSVSQLLTRTPYTPRSGWNSLERVFTAVEQDTPRNSAFIGIFLLGFSPTFLNAGGRIGGSWWFPGKVERWPSKAFIKVTHRRSGTLSGDIEDFELDFAPVKLVMLATMPRSFTTINNAINVPLICT